MSRSRRREKTAPRPRPFLLLATLAVIALLAATAEERTFGTISDEEQMLRTAVSMAEFGEVGIARGALFAIHRPAGDAVAPYGVGQSFAEVPASLAAGSWERRFGPGSSQTLFAGLEILLVAAASLGAALAARALGAGRSGVLLALFGTAFGSPLWTYVSAGYSEPFQAAALVFAFLWALLAGRSDGRRASALAIAAGAAAALAVLGKGLNVVLVPLVLAPLLLPKAGRTRRAAFSAIGFAPPFAHFFAFEFARYGRPFASYGGQGFTHPIADGLWRLLVGVNKGLLWYFPLLVAAAAGLVLLWRTARAAALAIGGTLAVLLVLSSAWWAWDGSVGWGPRLLVPAVPLLAAAAGVACAGAWRRPAWALLGLGVALNALGVFQPESATAAWVFTFPRATLTAAEARRFPPEFVEPLPDGRALIARQHLASSDAALAPFRVHLFLLRTRLLSSSPAELERRLARPPWASSRPELVPAAGAAPGGESLTAFDRQPFSWPHLFAASPRPRDGRSDAYAAAWDAALADQLLRALDLGLAERATALGERLLELTPSGYSAALYAEALRAAGRREMLASFLGTLPPEFRASPSLGVVQALAARDEGDEATARRILGSVARVFPRPAVVAALDQPLAAWPKGLHGMTGENRAGSRVALPGVGAAR